MNKKTIHPAPIDILIVDDIPLNLRLLVTILSQEGFKIRTAINGKVALEEVAKALPDLILLDIQMPQMDGYEVCEALKADQHCTPIPIIFLTAADDPESKVRAFASGAVDYITKPFNVTEVQVRIQTHIALARQRQELARQKAEIETLRDTAAVINSSLDFDEVLERILQNVNRVVEHDYANIMLLEDGYTRVVGCRGYASEDLHRLLASKYSGEMFSVFEMISLRQPIIIADVLNEPRWDWRWSPKDIRAYLGTPIISDGEVIGLLNLDSRQPEFFCLEDGQRLQAFADQVSIALKNARLYQQAKTLAATEERQRLARELHDAVSQTLFSAHVIAESLPSMFDKNLTLAREEVRQLGMLTKAALAEMRTLLIELRPSALVETHFILLLTHLVDSIRPNINGQVYFEVESSDETDLSDFTGNTKIQFYRIVQETLNNVVKHAYATEVKLSLKCTPNQVSLTVIDNGIGFDLEAVGQHHMGLRIMRERALNVGLDLQIVSVPKEGTRISVTWNKLR